MIPVEDISGLEILFKSLGLRDNQVADSIKKPKLRTALNEVVHEARLERGCDKAVGNLLLTLATVSNDVQVENRDIVAKAIAEGLVKSNLQVQEAVNYLKSHENSFNQMDFERASGIGVVITSSELKKRISMYFESHKESIVKERYKAQPSIMKALSTEECIKWADPKERLAEVEAQLLALLGPKNEVDLAPKKQPKLPAVSLSSTEKAVSSVSFDYSKMFREGWLGALHKPGDNLQIHPELMEAHINITGGKVQTRFPPEPNGYLHIGHSKAITVNFGYAKYNRGITYLRFDDTNPEAEEEKYFTNILETVKWLGFEPFKITYASDHFQRLYDLAEELIKRNKGYICHCTAEDIHKQRGGKDGKENPRYPCDHRSRPISESLAEFRAMRDGKYKPQEALLRMKQNLESGNPQMWDLTAYRVLEKPHHRTGSQWRIYPTYDFTHCLCDSFENITHSLCTTEFINSRESYEWLCDALEVFKPAQREYGRLNLSGTVMSKRKILQLVREGHVRDWDDPRLYTLVAIRRRGVPPGAILSFISELGVTTAKTTIDIMKFEQSVRSYMENIVPRLFMILDPIPVVLENVPSDFLQELKVPYKKGDASFGEHFLPFTRYIYIDRDDFAVDPPKGYKRLTPGGTVGLYQADYPIQAVSYTQDETGKVTEIRAKYLKETKSLKPKAYIQWLAYSPKHNSPIKLSEVRLSNPLFRSDNPEAHPNGFLADLSDNSEECIKSAMIEVGFHEIRQNSPWRENEGGVPEKRNSPETVRFQAMRVGYFCLDKDSNAVEDKYILNRIVTLKQDAGKD